MEPPVVVFKVGGSLLELPDLPVRIDAAIQLLAPCRPLLVIGGGEAANLVRRWDPIHSLDQQDAHWIALRAMALNEALVCRIHTKTRATSRRENAETMWQNGNVVVLDALNFVEREELQTGDLLPRNWQVTSDSIAAWVAAKWPAKSVVLLKSADLPDTLTLDAAADLRLVDAWLPQAGMTSVGWINLRATTLWLDSCGV